MQFPQLTFTRFIASMLVVLCHFANSKGVLALPVIGHFMRYAYSLLGYFFVLAGFVFVVSVAGADLPFNRIPAKWLIVKRLIRFYPVHLLALCLVAGLQQVLHTYHPDKVIPDEGVVSFVRQALLLHAWFPTGGFGYNYVSWTLCVELLLTALAPALYGWMSRQPTRPLAYRVVLIWAGALALHGLARQWGMSASWGYFWPPVHVPEFMLGMVAGFAVARHKPWLQERMRPLRWTTGANIILMLALTGLLSETLRKNTLVFAPVYALLIVNSAMANTRLTRLYASRPVQYLGELGFSIYMLQVPVAMVMLYLVGPWLGWKYKYQLLLYLVTLIGTAALVYEGFEKPIRAYAGAMLRRRRAVQPQPVPTT